MVELPEMIESGHIDVSEDERAALDELLEGKDVSATVTRRDPGETGPLLVHIGSVTFVIDGSKTTELTPDMSGDKE
jgi:hypothetical protein